MKSYVKSLFKEFFDEEGSSLALALAILIVVSSLIGIYLMTFRTTISVVKNEISYYRASINALSGMNYAVDLPSLDKIYDFYEYNVEDLQFNVERYLIGFSEEIYSSGFYQEQTVKRYGKILFHNKNYDNLALITGGRSFFNPVYVTGETRINGNVLTGKYGFSKQSIRNIYFKGKHIVNGSIYKERRSKVPELDYKSLDMILKSKPKEFIVNDTIMYLDFQTVSIRGRLPKKIIGPGTIFLSNNIDGLEEISHCNVIAKSELKINKKLMASDCMFYSEGGISLEGKKKNIQLISESRIVLKSSAELKEHSLIMVLGKLKQVKSRVPVIFMEAGAIFEGAVVYKEPKSYEYRDQYLPFDFKNKSKIMGVIYSPYGITSELNIEGMLIFNYSEIRFGGTRYQNYLKDLKISSKKEYLTLNFFPYTERALERTYEL